MDKERLQLAMDISEHGFWDWNLDTGDAYFSPTYYTMLGYEPGEFPPGYQSWFDLLHPEDQDAVVPRIREAAAQARPYEEEFRLKCKDGSWKWIWGKGKTYGLDNEGVPHRAAGLHIDIDEKKRAGELVQEAEKQYRSIFENAVEGIYQSTPAGTFHSVNPAFARILGYESPEELIGSVTDITAQLYVNPESRRELIRSVEEKGFVASHPVQLYRKDRSIAWLSISARPVQNEQGKLIYLEGIVEDITELKRVEEELRVSMERLRRVTGSVIEVIVQAVEVRDPYTAGHQKRAADLARAVASEMRLPPDRIAGIRTAAVIHDLGKISIPAEILSMPRKLTDIEYHLVMEHAQIGYNILKEIELGNF